jgi:GntR family transcriptional repressor for pyruvate dehydrogenase complex
MTADRPTGGLFTPVSTARMSSVIRDQIKEAIKGGHLAIGDRLPSERELGEQFGVSRVTVRDALRMLEASGLVAIRIGAHGGAFVTAPEPMLVSDTLSTMIAMSTTAAEEVTEARIIVELGTIALVCERATAEDVAALEEICDRSEAALETGTFDVKLSAEFHARLAKASHNEAVSLITDSLQGPILESLLRAKAIAPEMGDPGVTEHRTLVEAIKRRDVDAAHETMRTHLARTADRLARPLEP